MVGLGSACVVTGVPAFRGGYGDLHHRQWRLRVQLSGFALVPCRVFDSTRPKAPGNSGQPAQKGSNRSFEVLGLIEGKSVAGVWDLLDTDPRVDVAELTVRRRRANPRVIKRKMPRWLFTTICFLHY